MSVYLHGQYMTADTEQEAAQLAAKLMLPADRLRLAGTPRWHWLLTEADRQWAITEGAEEVDLVMFKMLVEVRRNLAGLPPSPDVIACGPKPRTPRRRRWNRDLRRHSWVNDREHVYHCDWCGIVTENRPVPKSGAWYKVWRWSWSTAPAGEWDGSTRDPGADGKVPSCPGPDAQPPTAPGQTALC